MNLFKPKRGTLDVVKYGKHIFDLPSPKNLSYGWNFGSMMGFLLFSQLLTGIFLSFQYTSYSSLSFSLLDLFTREKPKGWILRFLHVFGASYFFLFIYCHMGRGLFYFSFKLFFVWLSGVVLYLCSMLTAFMGYLLPWGQMSFWGASVITNFVSVVPYIGKTAVVGIWGDFSVSSPTLIRFFSLHYLFPMIMLVLVMFHVLVLHKTGSKNKVDSFSIDTLAFYPFFVFKDVFGFGILVFLMWFTFINPNKFMESVKFLTVNMFSTPEHIRPEWYFLAPYAVLRALPNKLGGVFLLMFFILALVVLPLYGKKFFTKKTAVAIMFVFFILSFMGACPVEYPYVDLGVSLTLFYFFLLLV